MITIRIQDGLQKIFYSERDTFKTAHLQLYLIKRLISIIFFVLPKNDKSLLITNFAVFFIVSFETHIQQ